MSEKKKKHSTRVGTIPFVLLWTLSYGLGWAGLAGSFLWSLESNTFDQLPAFVLVSMFGAIPGLISGIIQQPLIRWKFGTHIKRWWLWSTIGSILATGGYYGYFEFLESILRPFMQSLRGLNELLEPALVIGVLFLLYSSVQAWALRRYVKRVWVWSLAAFVSASMLVFAANSVVNLGMNGLLGTIFLGGFAGLAQGSVMALTLVWLFGMTRTEPLKRVMESTQLEQAEEKLAQSDMIDENIANYPEEQSLRQQHEREEKEAKQST